MELEGQSFPRGAHSAVCESAKGGYRLQPGKAFNVLLSEVTEAKVNARRWARTEHWLLGREGNWL